MADFKVYPDTDNILDRTPSKTQYERAYHGEKVLTQGSEINELETRQNDKRARVGGLTARDGDRIDGCDIITEDYDLGSYRLTDGRLYLRGDVRSIGEALLTGVSTLGDVQIGVRITEERITHVEDPDLLGQYADALSAGEPGAERVKYTLTWGWSGDGIDGILYAVYSLNNGYAINQAPPPSLTGTNAQIARYDYGAHENYIDEGCFVTALGKTGDEQFFSVGEGIANVLGLKWTRLMARRYAETEAPEIETVDAEPHVWDDVAGSYAFEVNHPPINGVISVVITKEHTETITRGGVANTADTLSKTGVTKIVTVDQGGTHYDITTDYLHDGDDIDWSPGGAEPATSSSYDITYEYLEAQAIDSATDTEITVSGGVDGGAVIASYSFKLPRVDRICFDQTGNIVYIKGISAREQPQPPVTPRVLLSLCEVHNDWYGTPVIKNNGIRNYSFAQIDAIYNRVVDLLDLTALERLKSDISAREPTAKHKVFVDPFTSDDYRDAGEAQDAAVFDETCQIAIDPAFHAVALPLPVSLDFSDEVIVNQEFSTDCSKINPYQVFLPLPLTLTISPSEDFWEQAATTWLSPITRVFGQGSLSRVTHTDIHETIASRSAVFLRQIPISFEVGNLGNGENLTTLTFDGVDVNPGGLSGDVNGQISNNFTIPANVTAGIKEVRAIGATGSSASARFEGRGTLTTTTRVRVSVITRWEPPVVIPAIPIEAGAVIPPPADGEWFDGGGNGAGDEGADPLAQTFMLQENRHISAIDVQFCTVGDTSKPVIVEIVEVANGVPTRNVVAQSEVDMTGVVIDVWHKISFVIPVFIPAGVDYAFVFRTDDADHAVSTAQRGGFDQALQKWVGAQPYTVGVLLASSNARTWTPRQDHDLTMRIYGAIFSPVTKTVDLGTIAVTSMSDLILAANVYLPTDQAQLRFQITPDGESAQLIENNQNLERSSFFTGNVKLEAVITGSAKISPVLSRDILAIPGSMRATGTYVSRVFDMGTAIRQDVRLKTKLPTGSVMTVEVDKNDDVWTAVSFSEAEALPDGRLDQLFTEDPFTAATGGRLKITLTGTPAARPAVADLRSYSI